MATKKLKKKSRLLKEIESGIKALKLPIPGTKGWAYGYLRPGEIFSVDRGSKAKYVGLRYKDGFLDLIVGELEKPYFAPNNITYNYVGCSPQVIWNCTAKDEEVIVELNVTFAATHFGTHPDKLEITTKAEERVEYRQVFEDLYPCIRCGAPRSKSEGGTTFTICDDCWDKKD
jgi:hypothetical protein